MPGHGAVSRFVAVASGGPRGLPPALEGLDDDHASAAAGAWRAEVVRFVWSCRHRAAAATASSSRAQREAGLAGGAGEQAVVPDAMEAARQDVEQEAADELVGRQRHDLLPVGAVAAIVLVAEGDAGLVEGDQAAGSRWRRGGCSATDRRAPPPVRRRAAWHRRPSASSGREQGGAGRRAGRRGAPWMPKKASRPASCSAISRVEEQPAEQLAEHAHRQQEGRARRDPAACRPARCRRPARSCARADGGSSPSPRCGARR